MTFHRITVFDDHGDRRLPAIKAEWFAIDDAPGGTTLFTFYNKHNQKVAAVIASPCQSIMVTKFEEGEL